MPPPATARPSPAITTRSAGRRSQSCAAASTRTSSAFSVIETWSYATFIKPDSRPVGVEYLGAILLNFALLAAWSALYYGINYYLLLEEEIDQRGKLESQASSAQLAMLRYQLNPHFLFNTLNSISTLVLLKQTERANAMLARLSSFLRYTLVGWWIAGGALWIFQHFNLTTG